MNEPIAATLNQPPQAKQRHGCLTALLVVIIVANSATSVLYLMGSERNQKAAPEMPGWGFPVLTAAAMFNVVCAVALFKWKLWGFRGFVCSAGVAMVVNVVGGISAAAAVSGLLGIAVLYGVLQIGQERKGWTQLE